MERPTAPWRRQFTAREWLDLACAHLEIKPEILCGRRREKDAVRWRKLVDLVGTERFGVKVRALATELGKSPNGVSQWYRRGVVRRSEDAAFAAAAEALDRAASEAHRGVQLRSAVPGTIPILRPSQQRAHPFLPRVN